MAEIVLWSWIYSAMIVWLAKLRRDHERERGARMQRQRRQRVGQDPVLRPRGDLDAQEELLLSILRERRSKGAH